MQQSPCAGVLAKPSTVTADISSVETRRDRRTAIWRDAGADTWL
jgi:hypothetical protein